jgi:hypothetical protein
MTTSSLRRARRAGMTVKKCRRGTVYTDPLTGKSIYDGNRSKKSFRQERLIDNFLRNAERLGLD